MFEILAYSSVGAIVVKLLDMIMDRIKRHDTKQDNNDLVLKTIKEIENKLDNHIATEAEDKANQARLRLLRFDGEIRNGSNHTKEHWDNVLEDIDAYEAYCSSHPLYPNSKAVSCIAHIKNVYSNKLTANDFL